MSSEASPHPQNDVAEIPEQLADRSSNEIGLFVATPLSITPERNAVLDQILDNVEKVDSVFADTQTQSLTRRKAVAAALTRIDSVTWEIWRTSASIPVDLVGIIHLSHVVSGCDAKAHPVFFDGKLANKTLLMEQMISWVFEDHAEVGWVALRRLTLEVPGFAFALARHAQRKLKFGGEFTYKIGGHKLKIEGVKRNAVLWRGTPQDLLTMGRVNPNV